MALTVTLEFSEDELDYFRSLMHRVRDRNGQRPQHEVAAAAVAEVERLRATAHSPFIRRRIDPERIAILDVRLRELIAALRDKVPAPPAACRRR